jgi:hypothetical protein
MDNIEGFDPIRILAALQAHGVRAVVVGGLAAIAHGSTAATDDVDICVDGADANLDKLALALAQLGARSLDAGESGGAPRETFQTNAGRLDCIELAPSQFTELDAGASTIDVGRGVQARVAALDALHELKRSTGDLADTFRIAALTSDVTVELDERDELSRDDEPVRARDKVWKALEGVDTFLTKLVER